ARFTAEAATSTSTSPGPATGSSTSVRRRVSGPLSYEIAFMPSDGSRVGPGGQAGWVRPPAVHYDERRRQRGFHVEPRGRACRGGRRGSVAERPNALALKASVPKQHRGFKSLHFRPC